MFIAKNETVRLVRQCLVEFAIYLKKNYYKQEKQQLKGEFHTILRRHLSLYTKPSGFNITKDDIHYYCDNKTGILQHVEFVNTSMRNENKERGIEELNKAIEKLSIDYEKETFYKQLESIIENIKYKQI